VSVFVRQGRGFAPLISGVYARRGGGLAYTSLIEPGEFSATLTRAQTSTVATGTDTSSAIVEYASADTPRWTGAAQRLLIETQRTNSIRNPRFEGASVGTPGDPGTNLILSQPGSGVSAAIVATGTEAGMAYIDVQVSGTASAAISTDNFLLQLEGTQQIVAAMSQTWSGSFYARIVAGALAGTLSLDLAERTSTGASATINKATVTPTGTLSRLTRTVALSNASTAYVMPVLRWGCNSGTVVDFTLRLMGPQCEQGTTVSSLILPPVGSPAASTRGQDFVTANFASLFPSGAGTLLMACSLVDASVSANQTLAQVEQDANNRFLIRSNSSGAFQALRVTGGASSSATGASISDATLFRCGMAFDGAGRVAASLNGAAAIAVTGGPTSGLTTLRLGYSDSGALVQSGEFGSARAYSYAMSDADLAAAVAAL
jgi:hypothetical protein